MDELAELECKKGIHKRARQKICDSVDNWEGKPFGSLFITAARVSVDDVDIAPQ